MAKPKLKFEMVPALLMLDLGTGNGSRKPAGYLGVDRTEREGVDKVADLLEPWPWEDNSVEEAQAIHLLQQFTAQQRIHFVNELYRVLKPGCRCLLIVPYWASGTAYGNLLNVWPPVAEHWFYYLNREWRAVHDIGGIEYACDFDFTLGYGLHPAVQLRSQEYQQHAIQHFKEAAQDLIVTVTKR